MSKIKRVTLKKFSLILGLVLFMALGITGIGYGAWNDLLQIDFSLATAEFEPQVEVYKIARENPNFPARTTIFNLDPVIRPDGGGVITVNIGQDLPCPPSLRAIWDNAWRNDKYTVYYRVVNNSTIPIHYRTVELSSTAQAPYIAVSPDHTGWTEVLAEGSAANNYASIEIKYKYALLPANRINPFGLPLWGQGGQIDHAIARVEIRQFNSAGTDSGWIKNVNIHICTNEFLDLDPSAGNGVLKSNSSGGTEELKGSVGTQSLGAGLEDSSAESGSDSFGEFMDTGNVAGQGESFGENESGENGNAEAGDPGNGVEPDASGESGDDSGNDSGNNSGNDSDNDSGENGETGPGEPE
ncbi:MAG: hypothetical protein RBT41_02465 [Clostridia bacterium]|jgi:hypothetical protein|nr:hypothetical protein [Clostridia bacterium]